MIDHESRTTLRLNSIISLASDFANATLQGRDRTLTAAEQENLIEQSFALAQKFMAEVDRLAELAKPAANPNAQH